MSEIGSKTALVTGAGTGVGAATALGLAKRGYDVLLNYSKSEREAREVEAACREAGADTLLVQGNVADDGDCRRLAAAAIERWQRLDALSTTPASAYLPRRRPGMRSMPRPSSASTPST